MSGELPLPHKDGDQATGLGELVTVYKLSHCSPKQEEDPLQNP